MDVTVPVSQFLNMLRFHPAHERDRVTAPGVIDEMLENLTEAIPVTANRRTVPIAPGLT
jgi:hypothetical protein